MHHHHDPLPDALFNLPIWCVSLAACMILASGAGLCLAQPADGGGDVQAYAAGNTRFAADLYSKLKIQKGNLFFSPYSVSTALSMTYGGAKENTAKQMAKALRFELPAERLHSAAAMLDKRLNAVQEKGQVRLHVANSLWPNRGYPFLQDFLELAKRCYGVVITAVDYATQAEAARLQINAWVEEKTAGKIRDLIGPGILTELTRLVLVNAIYFKGNWALQFDGKRTQDAPFHLSGGGTADVLLMTQTAKFGYADQRDFQVLELDYVGNDLSMVVILPKEKDGIAALEQSLDSKRLSDWLSRLPQRKVRVFLPRFKMTAAFRLDAALRSLGMTDAFNMTKADFSGMDGRKPWLYIGAVLHKAFVEVNEEGTEAAAATAVVMTTKGMAEMPPVFRADHPFIFLIRENKTGSVLFLGRLADPKA